MDTKLDPGDRSLVEVGVGRRSYSYSFWPREVGATSDEYRGDKFPRAMLSRPRIKFNALGSFSWGRESMPPCQCDANNRSHKRVKSRSPLPCQGDVLPGTIPGPGLDA